MPSTFLFHLISRVPSLFHWEGKIAPGFSDKIATHMDVAPTVMNIVTGNATAADDDMHGVDLSPILFGDSDQVLCDSIMIHSLISFVIGLSFRPPDNSCYFTTTVRVRREAA